MPDNPEAARRRVLVIDDNPEIREDFRKILQPAAAESSALADSEAALFGESSKQPPGLRFELDAASQGTEGAALVRRAVYEARPYAMAFIDMRMPPGWDGLETTARIWEIDPAVQVVICTAYSDHSWADVHRRLGHTDRLLILKKPFDNIEVLQLASALTEKWRLEEVMRYRVRELEALVERRTMELELARAQLSGLLNDKGQQ